MKKILSLVVGIIFLAQFFTSHQIYVASLNSQGTQLNKFENIEANVRYYDTSPRVEYQLSQEQLNLPTDELVDVILDFPYLVDFLCVATPDAVYSNLKNSFNGFSELEKRSDAATILLEKLLNEDISGSENYLRYLYLNKILSVSLYSKSLSEIELSSYLRDTNAENLVVGSVAAQ